MPNSAKIWDSILGSRFTYTSRPDPISGDLRLSWGISILLLSLFFSRRQTSNFQKLQFMTHAVLSPEGRHEIRGLLSGEYSPREVSVRVEPSLNRAVALSSALKLVSVEKGRSIKLTAAGEKLAEEIAGERSGALEVEANFLREVAPKMTDALMKKVWRLEDIQ
ncbi:helix-turn-helix domain-containing protein [Marinovum algicola]|uniref:hypothetical protein n=1 Tax=Marinovum algicola TaxID=42444 RepID=UPI000944FF64|nr:hypothetical protein [Marinovum algicola]